MRILELRDLDASLSGGVAVANGDGAILESIKVDDDTLRRADFVLFPVTLADVAGIVPSDVYVFFLQKIVDFFGFFYQFGFVF